MKTASPSQSQLIAAVRELVTARSLDALRDVLKRHSFLTSPETDQQLTRVIQAGLERKAIANISVLIAARGFLSGLHRGSLEWAKDALGGLPLYQTDPIGQLTRDPQPSPDHLNLCRRALKIVRHDTEPNLWAYLQFLLADRLVLFGGARTFHTSREPHLYRLPIDDLESGCTPANIHQAMAAYEVACDTWEACQEFTCAAQARYELARLLVDFTSGEGRTAALERAIKLLKSTCAVWTREAQPQEWGNVQALLGLALKNMPSGLDARVLERAIKHYEAALEVPVAQSFDPAFEKARRQYHLATLYARRYQGDRIENIERAIELLQAALEVQTRDTYPEAWADAQNALANTLLQRLRGDPAQNIEEAIKVYEAALHVWTRDRNPVRWATIERNLAEAHRLRILGQATKNQEAAIAHFDKALNIYTHHDHPYQWASVHNSLANLYCNRLRGGRAYNIETGIEHYGRALEIYTRAAYPRQWAQTMNNLANAYCERERGDHFENLRTAIALYEQVFEVRTCDDYPREWAATHNNIGTAYASLGEWKQAAEHFRKALEVRTVGVLPDKALQSARNLGALHFRLGQWDEAISAYRTAQKASDALYHQAITEVGKRAEIGRGGEVTHPLAYALARKGKLREAALELEHGRARLLAEALARGRVVLNQASDRNRAEYEKVVSRIQALQSELRAVELAAQGEADAPGTARPFGKVAEDLAAASKDRDRILKVIGRVAGNENLLGQPRFADIEEAVQPDMPLIYLAAVPAGGVALIVQDKGVKRVWLDDLNDEALLAQVQEWLGRYFAYSQAGKSCARLKPARQAWFAVLEDITRWLWEVAMGRLVTSLRKLGHCRATLIPTGLLAFLPLHAAWHPPNANSSRRYALDEVAFAYAPSAHALTHAQRLAAASSGEKLFVVNNPDGSLRYANQEVRAVRRHFSRYREVAYEKATRNTALKVLPKYGVYHFACHGSNNWLSPLESALEMYGGRPLTVAHLLELEGRIQAQLAFLSACETGLVGTELPDEVVGLAAGFMQAGTASVISSLWRVNDESTAALATRFYENWKERGMSPLEALVAAQQFVRDEASNGLWAHPYYWAALMLMGA
jgi:CHAT domain-containing protein